VTQLLRDNNNLVPITGQQCPATGHVIIVLKYQSIKIYFFLSNRKILQCITVYASAQKAAREAYAH